MPDLRSLSRTEMRGHQVTTWIPAFAGMTTFGYLIAEVL